MADLESIKKQLGEARKNRAALEAKLRLEKEVLKKLSAQIEKLKRSQTATSAQELKKLEATYKEKLFTWKKDNATHDQLEANVLALEKQLADAAPVSEQITGWSDSESIALLPVRLECRFMPVDSSVKTQLYIRVYPDDIHIDTHEPLLTTNEFSLLKSYWTSVWKAAKDETMLKGAWRVLCSAIGSQRAGYLVQKFLPINPSDAPTNQVNEENDLAIEPQFQNMELRSESWSRPPLAKALPDRFVFMGWFNGKKVFEETGEFISDKLAVGIDPDPLDETDKIKRDGTDLHIQKGMQWLTHFGTAVTAGMGIVIELKDLPAGIQKNGFDRIVALGLRISDGITEGQKLLEDLIDAHHYTPEGFSLVPQGMATNNTGEVESGYSSFDLGEETSYAVEASDPLFATTPDWKIKKDGEIFAEWMGIDSEILNHLQYADGLDQCDVRAMNQALWPGTLGYFLEEMMDPFFTKEDISYTKDFFVNYVKGRGTIPAIRKGKQPYGILPITVFSKFIFTSNEDKNKTAWNNKLLSLLKLLDKTWTELVKNVSHAGKSGDPYALLLDMLGLHPNSVEFYQRYSVGENYVTNLMNFEGFAKVSVLWYQNRKQEAEDLLVELGYSADALPVIASFSWFNSSTLLDGPVVDTVPISESEQLSTYANGKNYLQWLVENDLDTIRAEDFGTETKPQSLLYLHLRNSFLQSVWDGSWNILNPGSTVSRTENELLYIGKENFNKGKWETVYSPHPATTGSAEIGIGQYITSLTDFSSLGNSTTNLADLKEGISLLTERHTAHLERAFVEHLDLCSYRLDAWWWGLANQRLEEIRYRLIPGGKNKNWQKGTYVGAYGYLENLKPDAKPLDKVNAAIVPDELKDAVKNPLYADPQNGGYLFTPSTQHAITAAVLRNAYLTNSDETNPDKYSIDLSSARVRKALVLIEGIRNGQELGELLGYQLERGLHDRYAEKEMDTWIYELRETFPLYDDQAKGNGITHSSTSSLARNVVNGLSLIEYIREKNIANYPWGKDLPASDAVANKIIDEEVGKIQDMLDALGDLMMAESVHQTVKGNYDRSAAALRSIYESTLPPRPEFIESPSGGFSLTHRVALQFEPDAGSDADSPRVQVAYGLNKWLTSVLPNAANVKCISRFNETDSQIVTWENLKLQPIDLLYIFSVEPETAKGELDARVQAFVRTTKLLSDTVSITTDYSERDGSWTSAELTFFEITPLLLSLRKLIVPAKYLNASDLYLPSEVSDNGVATGVDLTELATRVNKQNSNLVALQTLFTNALVPFSTDTIPTSTEFDTLRKLMLQIADYGIENSYPLSLFDTDQTAKDKLSVQGLALNSKISSLLSEYAILTTFSTDVSESTQVDGWINASAKIFGGGFRIIPAFNLSNATEISNSTTRDFSAFLSGSDSPLPIDDWMYGLARVRPRMEAAEHIELFSSEFGTSGWNWTPVQLPYVEDDHWLAHKLPAGYIPTGDALLATIHHAETFDIAKMQCGLLLDEWVEVIPAQQQNAGLAFHFDAPNSEPPNTILLAVTPEITGTWKWDNLVDSILETMDMAKKRAVEPTQIDGTPLAQFIPALTMAVTKLSTTLSTNLLQNISTDAVLNTKLS
jgi:hypothetical protein